jgi:hypothetical protein
MIASIAAFARSQSISPTPLDLSQRLSKGMIAMTNVTTALKLQREPQGIGSSLRKMAGLPLLRQS